MFNAFQSTAATGHQQPTLLGNPAPQQQQQQTSLFGNPAAQQQPQQQNSLFGSTNTGQPTQTGASLFGGQAQTQPQSNPNLFGGQQQTNPNPLFGGQQQQPAKSTSLFGNGFGSTSAQPQQQQQTSLFGSTNTAPQQQQPQPAGSLFGNPAQSQPNQPSLFGSTSTAAPQQGSSLFGSTNAQQQQQPSLFGAPSQAPKPALFGGSTTGSLFGGNTSTLNTSALGTNNFTTTGSLFGNPANNNNAPAGGSLFGNPSTNNNNSLLNRQPLGGNSGAQQQADAAAQFAQLTQRIESVAQGWNANSKDCRFQYYFYNLVDPNHVSMYGRPQNATNEELWQQAVRGNPDPTCLVPVLAVGFDDLRQRVDAQSQQAASHQEKLKELKTRITALAQRHTTSNASRASRAAATQTQLTQRLIAMVQHLHLSIPSLRGSALKPEEEALRGLLEAIEEELRRGRGQSKLNELWALVGSVNANGGNKREDRGGWAVVDEEGMAQLSKILTDQQLGLAHLTKVLLRNLKDLSVITGTESTSVKDSQMQDHLWNSTGTLRESSLR